MKSREVKSCSSTFEIVWGIAADDVPKLLTEVRAVMGDSP